MHRAKLDSFIRRLELGGGTQLGIGPVSKNTLDATIKVAYQYRQPLLAICSRRQVESSVFGGGYVENWTTEAFAEYIKKRDPEGLIFLCRDHGGPWQNSFEIEKNLTETEALASCLESFKEDIDAGFNFIHIDTGISPTGEPPQETAIQRLVYLYEEVVRYAEQQGRAIAIEIGTEDQKGTTVEPAIFEATLSTILLKLRNKNLPPPTFVVIQTATKVMECQNEGTFTNPKLRGQITEEIQKVLQICKRLGIHSKAHNCDYLDEESLRSFAKLGISAANVAPEFGAVETSVLLSLFEQNGLLEDREYFIELANQSRKWEKWTEAGLTLSREDKTRICGHYLFAHPRFIQLKDKLSAKLLAQGKKLDSLLQAAIVQQIEKYISFFSSESSDDLAASLPLEKRLSLSNDSAALS